MTLGTGMAAYQVIARAMPDAAELDAPLAQYSWVGVGGPADLLVVARSKDELVRAVKLARAHGVPWRVYGGLTNILLPDSGLRGVVVLNRARDVRFEDGYRVVADSGAIVVKVAREAVERGWGGLTWAVGLPGTIGGAVVNNAGAFGGEISRVLDCAEVLTPDGDLERVQKEWFGFQYRCSKLKGAGDRWLVVRTAFQLRPADREHLVKKAAEYTERRQRSQPPGRTLGSTFKNPPGDYAGRLIEACGLKGARCGGIAVSEHHANFFINDGTGTAADFRALLEQVKGAVRKQFGVELEPEIEILPEAEDG
ncbi:MAG: UDP-N-acetylmuramate dehydrogenase [Anaerolineae bacterium]